MRSTGAKLVKYKDLWVEESRKVIKIQKTELTDGSTQIHLFAVLSKWDKEHGVFMFSPSYESIRSEIEGLVEIYGKAEVEKELGVKIV